MSKEILFSKNSPRTRGIDFRFPHTAGSDTIFVQIYMDTPPGVPGVSKNQKKISQIKLLSFCANIASKRHKPQKTIKIEKKM